MILVGDLGGTKTDLAIISQNTGARVRLAEATLPSTAFASLEALIRHFLALSGVAVEQAVLGVAGPVLDGRAVITNLPWVIEEQQLEASLGLSSVRLLNDLTAIATAVPHLLPPPEEQFILNPGVPHPRGAMAVVAPGTGLGEAFLTWEGSHYRAHPSEGGHASFSPVSDEQLGLLNYLVKRYGHVSSERVCSGSGLPNIYDYLRDSGYADEPGWLAEKLSHAPDRTPVIVAVALERSRRPGGELCRATLRMFVSILGAEAGNLALKVLATGGVYLAGGIPPRIIPALTDRCFMDSFCAKGRMAEMLGRVPVHVLLNQKAALIGAAYYALSVGGWAA